MGYYTNPIEIGTYLKISLKKQRKTPAILNWCQYYITLLAYTD